jgi:hypothetical protein
MNPDIAPDEGCDCPAILWGSIYTGRRMRTPIRPWAYGKTGENAQRSTSNARRSIQKERVERSALIVGGFPNLYLFRTSTMSSAFQVAVNE